MQLARKKKTQTTLLFFENVSMIIFFPALGFELALQR
jgi:hypothetical protein